MLSVRDLCVLLLLVAARPASAELCSSCPCLSASLLATDAGGTYSCGARVAWVMANLGQDQTSACIYVSNEFPTTCTYNVQNCDTATNCGGDVIVQNTNPSCPKLTWSDEFSGNALDTTKWSYQTGDGCSEGLCGWGNNENQWYQSDNVKVSNGRLVIEARTEAVGGKQYSSGRIRTKGLADFQYGRLEASIKIPTGQGIWPAFWMLPTQQVYGGWPMSGEIDIMEAIGREPTKTFGTLHYGPAWPNNKHQGSAVELLNNEIFADKFHEFAIDWTPGKITWSMDGASYLTLTKDTVTPWPFNEQFHFLLNVAVGGSWPGNPDGTSTFPQQMQVDYVRVYDRSLGRLQGPMYLDAKAKRIKFRIQAGLGDYSYSWSVPSGVKILTSNPSLSNRIVVNWGQQSGYISVTAKSKKCGISKTFTLPVSVIPPDTSSVIQDCSCPKCTSSVLHRMAGDFSCIARMEYMVQSSKMSEQDACAFVSNEFPAICGPKCDPTKCDVATFQAQAVVTQQVMPVARCARQIVKNCSCERLRKNKTCWAGVLDNECAASSLSEAEHDEFAREVVTRAKRVCLKRRLATNRH